MPIFNRSWSSVALSPSGVQMRMQFVFGCFHFLSLGKQSSGSMRTVSKLIHGANVQKHSSRSSSRWVKPMLFVGGFQVFSKQQPSPFQRLGRGFRSTSWPVLTRIGKNRGLREYHMRRMILWRRWGREPWMSTHEARAIAAWNGQLRQRGCLERTGNL